MPKTVIPFAHGDISELAKHLRAFTNEKCGCAPKQTEVLNFLARSAGHRNFQSFRVDPTKIDKIENKQNLVILKIEPPNDIDEKHQRNIRTGLLIDRRDQEVKELYFSTNVTIDTGSRSTEIAVLVTGRGSSWNFNSEYIPDKDRISEDILRAVANRLEKSALFPFETLSVDVGLSRSGAEKDLYCRSISHDFKVTSKKLLSYNESISLTDQARDECNQIFSWMLTKAKYTTITLDEVIAVRQSADYMEELAEISGERHVYSLNKEKAYGICKIFRRFAKVEKIDDDDQQYVERNLRLFNAPPAWTREPPYIGDELRNAIYSVYKENT